jgi:hypothetical protein
MSGVQQAIWYHLITVVSLLLFKLAVLFVGYLIAKLGYELLVKGVTGEFKFQTQYRGAKADLISASPGIFFILMATALLAIGVLKDKPFETTVTTGAVGTTGEHEPQSENKPTLRPHPTVTPESEVKK